MIYDNPNAQMVLNFQEGVLDAIRATEFALVIHPVDRHSPGLFDPRDRRDAGIGRCDDLITRAHAGGAKGAVHADRVREIEVARTGRKDRRWKASEIGEQRRKVGIGEIVSISVEQVDRHQAGQAGIDTVVGRKTVARFGKIDFRRPQDQSSGHRQSFIARAQDQCRGQIATR